jgi:DnaJ-class molecular chaperone
MTEPLCNYCNGSGEGMTDGSRCGHCNGSGVERDYDAEYKAKCDRADQLNDEARFEELS